MWLSVWWQFAQIADDTSWKLTRPPPLVGLAMAVNGHTPLYGTAPPTFCAGPTSAGNRTQSKVSWTQRTRRNARFETNDDITPGLVSTPALGPPFAHSASVNTPVASLKVGQLLLAFVN